MSETIKKVGTTKVELNPSEQVVKAPADVGNVNQVKDLNGRIIEVYEPDLLAQFRMTEAAGKSSSNEGYMNMIRPLLYLKSIDGDLVVPPNTKAEIEALIKRLGSDGYNALAECLVKKYSNESDGLDSVEKLKK
jgi:hypothetical protein